MNPLLDIRRTVALDTLAVIASTDETLAYVLHSSEDPQQREFAEQCINQSNDIKRRFRENLDGAERDLYLLRAEGRYFGPGGSV